MARWVGGREREDDRANLTAPTTAHREHRRGRGCAEIEKEKEHEKTEEKKEGGWGVGGMQGRFGGKSGTADWIQLVFDRQERVAAATAARKDHAKRRLRAILVSENCYVFSNYELEHVRTDFSNF